jgi:hypothetical protein
LYGILLSEIYTLLFAVWMVGGSLLEGSTRATFSEVLGGILVVLFSGQFYGIVPAAIVGLVTGTLIGATALHLSERDERAASNLGAFWALAIALPVHGALIVGGVERPSFIILFGLPTLIYVGAAIVITRRSRRFLPDSVPAGSLNPGRLRVPTMVFAAAEIALLLFYFFGF